MDESTVKTSSSQPYPRFVFCIIVHEFFERFAFYGARSVLMMFLVSLKSGYFSSCVFFIFQITFLRFDNDLATVLYHTFVALCYFIPIFGGILSDSYWGKVKTIIILGIVQNKLIWSNRQNDRIFSSLWAYKKLIKNRNFIFHWYAYTHDRHCASIGLNCGWLSYPWRCESNPHLHWFIYNCIWKWRY